MKEYKFTLDRSSRKFICPACNRKRFVRFIDRQTGQYLPEIYGRCDRQQNCGYFKKPGSNSLFVPIMNHHEPKRLNSIISTDLVNASLKAYGQNNFVSWLRSFYTDEQVQQLIDRYFIGTSKQGCIFWQLDQERKVRAGKIIQYDPVTGHRRKDINPKWVHKILQLKNFELKQCLFGLHLTKGLKQDRVVCIVEAEKTAIVCSGFFPDMIWLATGGLQNFQTEKLEPLKRFWIMLFPDAGCYSIWNSKALKIQSEIPGIKLKVSDFLEKNTPETHRIKGYDLADYLTNKQLQDCLKPVL
ncbi:MAG: DUF6371 domain-containing protein [Lentimicrobium sp.]|nr:DUF6371 domain-containing protein [Lentimicrobium sp.]MEA5110951.1 DUF6371 domain-containing protein [Lentimicrobium sp.]